MKFTSYLTLFYLLITTDVSSTSTKFDQNLILNDDFKILYSNEKQIINKAIQLHLKGNIPGAIKYYQHIINKGCNDHRVFLSELRCCCIIYYYYYKIYYYYY